MGMLQPPFAKDQAPALGAVLHEAVPSGRRRKHYSRSLQADVEKVDMAVDRSNGASLKGCHIVGKQK